LKSSANLYLNRQKGIDHYLSCTKGTQKIFFIKKQQVTIPVPGTKILKLALAAGFAVKNSILPWATRFLKSSVLITVELQ
jgi:hypothetical protein